MSPTKSKDTDQTDEAEVAAAEQEAEAAAPEYVEPRDVEVTITFKVRTDNPDVTDEAIQAAAATQVGIPSGISVDKPGVSGSLYLVVVPEPPKEETSA